MRIGLFGGSFNPIHNGHVALAGQALKQLGLDKLVFIPAYTPPHKRDERLLGAEERFKMIEMAVSSVKGFEVSRYEIDRKGLSYTIDTVRHFMGLYPKDTEFFFLVGSDSLSELNRWKEAPALLRLCRFAVAKRPGVTEDGSLPDAERIEMAPVEISSTEIRKRLRDKKGIAGLVPKAVEDYITKKNLYR